MNHDEVKGKANVVKGKLEQIAGNVSNDPELHDRGVVDEVAGRTQDTLGHVKRQIHNVVESVRKS